MTSNCPVSPHALASHSALLNTAVLQNPQKHPTHFRSWERCTVLAMAAPQWQPSVQIFFLLLPAPHMPTIPEVEGTA